MLKMIQSLGAIAITRSLQELRSTTISWYSWKLLGAAGSCWELLGAEAPHGFVLLLLGWARLQVQ